MAAMAEAANMLLPLSSAAWVTVEDGDRKIEDGASDFRSLTDDWPFSILDPSSSMLDSASSIASAISDVGGFTESEVEAPGFKAAS
jgi:hypothetical protein